jgi:hypothetical protein
VVIWALGATTLFFFFFVQKAVSHLPTSPDKNYNPPLITTEVYITNAFNKLFSIVDDINISYNNSSSEENYIQPVASTPFSFGEYFLLNQ